MLSLLLNGLLPGCIFRFLSALVMFCQGEQRTKTIAMLMGYYTAGDKTLA